VEVLASQLLARRVDLLKELGYSCCFLTLAISNVPHLYDLLTDRLSDVYSSM
jgi:hypothetical protein